MNPATRTAVDALLAPTPDFNPNAFPGFLGWWSALRVAFSTSTPGVQAVPEMTGNGHDMSPVTGNATGAYLTWRQDPLANGRPTLQQDLSIATTQGLQASVNVSLPLTFYVTCYLTGANTQDMVSLNANGTGPGGQLRWFSTGTTWTFRVGGSANAITVNNVAINQPHVACISYAPSGSLSQVWVDDAVNVAGSVVTNAAIAAMTNFLILCNNGSAAELGGRIGDAMLFTGSHGTATRQQVMGFLGRSNGVNVANAL